jgi:hypothetical protein
VRAKIDAFCLQSDAEKSIQTDIPDLPRSVKRFMLQAHHNGAEEGSSKRGRFFGPVRHVNGFPSQHVKCQAVKVTEERVVVFTAVVIQDRENVLLSVRKERGGRRDSLFVPKLSLPLSL